MAGKSTAPAKCGCEAKDGRRAVGVDPAIKAANLRRLRRIEGQIRGLQKMVDDERYCADIVTQVASVQEALRGVARQLMRNHLKHCATSAIKQGDTVRQKNAIVWSLGADGKVGENDEVRSW